MTNEQQLDESTPSFIGEEVWAYVHTHAPNRIVIEGANDSNDAFLDFTLEEAQGLRDWLFLVLP